MGRPMPQVCALSGCEAINTNIHAEKQGQFFDLHDILFSSSRRSKSSSTQLWACCNEHKLAALALVLKDLPYLGKTEVLLEA